MSEKTTEHKSFKSRWDNYWYYYKIHTWVAIFVVFIVVFSIVQCAHTVKPDVSVDLVTAVSVTDVTIDLAGEFDDVLADANGDGEKHITVSAIYLPEQISSEQDIAMSQKMMLELAAGDVTLFLFDKVNLDRYITQDAFSALSDFIDIAPYENEEGKLVSRDGVPYAIYLKGSAKLHELGFTTDELYGAFRFVPEDAKDSEKKMAEYQNAAAILTELLKQ